MLPIAKGHFPALRYFGVGLLALALHGANAQVLSLASNPNMLAKAALDSQPGAAAVGVWREGQPSYGYARNDSAGQAVRGEPPGQALFEIGSVSKVFTGLLLAQAVERGDLSLDDTLGRLLQGQAQLSAPVGAITLRQLVTHSSCLPRMPANFAGDAAPENPYPNYSWDKMLAALMVLKLRAGAPCDAVYSNLGVALLGELLAQRYQKPWDELVRERITAPLGMHDTVRALGDKAPRLAVPYAGAKPASAWEMQAFAGAGGLRSTSADMLIFSRALLEGKTGPLGAAAERLLTPLGKIDFDDIGYAVMMRGPVGKRTYLHGGGTGGYRTQWMIMPDTQEAIIVMASNAAAPIHTVDRDILAARYPLSNQVTTAEPNRLPEYAGVFRLNKALAFTFVVQADTLYGRLSGQPFSALAPTGEDSFTLAAVGAQFSFSRDNGKVGAVTLTQRGAVVSAPRVDEPVPTLALLDTEAAQAYSGRYRASDGTEFAVRSARGQLSVTVNDQQRLFVFPMSGQADRFLEELTRAVGQFERDANGTVVRLVVHREGQDTVALRVAEKPPAFSEVPTYLRGSMNNWGIQSRFVADGAGQYSASLVLAPGSHAFKVGSEDWRTIDFGGAGGSKALALGSATALHEAGSNLIIEVPRQGSYKFTLNTANPRAPVLTVTGD